METSQRVEFTIENNTDDFISLEENKAAGFGLKNVKKRLELLYPGKHELRIINAGTTYRIELCICIQKP